MKIYTCDDFEGHYPVGAAAVVVAPDRPAARVLLARALTERGLPYRGTRGQGAEPTLTELDTTTAAAFVLVDGNY